MRTRSGSLMFAAALTGCLTGCLPGLEEPAFQADTGDAESTGCSDPAIWYADADGDGYGAGLGIEACTAPIDHVEQSGDCDDGDAAISPDAAERCATLGVDDDCDGQSDEDDAVDAESWYVDADDDGYGSADDAVQACTAPSGYLDDDTDCDDGDSAINPDATDRCDDVDDNCSGDESDALDALTWYPDADGDGFGDADGAISSCEIPKNGLTDDTDCDDTDAAVNPDAEEICNNGVDDDCDETANDCGVGETAFLLRSSGSGGPYYYRSRNLVADIDGDGFHDAIVGDWTDESEVVVYPGPMEAAVGSVRRFGESHAAEGAGLGLASAGDLDGDGVIELLIGAPGNDDEAEDAGAAYLIYGFNTGADSLSDANMVFRGETSSAWAGNDESGGIGSSLAGGFDLDGDGLTEIAIGAPGGEGGAGVVHILTGAPTGSRGPEDAEASWRGTTGNEQLGAALASAGDIDGDGLDELLMGAPGVDDYVGAVYIVGAASGDMPLSDAVGLVQGEQAGDQAGSSLAMGDLDDDGVPDVVIGSPHRVLSSNDEGVVHVALGPLSGTISLADVKLSHESKGRGDYFGDSLATGDVDGDGVDDLIVGTYYAGCYDYTLHSGLYLFRGSGSAFSVTSPEVIAEGACDGSWGEQGEGMNVAVGDLNGDGYADILTGSWESSYTQTDFSTEVFLGGGL